MERDALGAQAALAAGLAIDQHERVMHHQPGGAQHVRHLQQRAPAGHQVVDQRDRLAGQVVALDLLVDVPVLRFRMRVDQRHVGGERKRGGDVQAAHRDSRDQLERGDVRMHHSGQGAGLLCQQLADPPQRPRVRDQPPHVDVDGRVLGRAEVEFAEQDRARVPERAGEPEVRRLLLVRRPSGSGHAAQGTRTLSAPPATAQDAESGGPPAPPAGSRPRCRPSSSGSPATTSRRAAARSRWASRAAGCPSRSARRS